MRHVLHARSGLSLVEVAIGLALLAVVGFQAAEIFHFSAKSQSEGVSTLALDEHARSVIERITFAVMGADPESLGPEVGPRWDADTLRYRVNLGIQDGEVVWGDSEEIGLTDSVGQVAWRQRPDELDERRVIWSNAVRPFLQGELPNGVDDNGNGLVDESGISFDVDGDLVTVRVTLETPRAGQEPLMRTLEARVTCRN